MFDHAFLKAGYDAELARKDALSEALTLPAGVLVALVGALAVMGQGFPYHRATATTIFIAMLAADGLCLLGCLICLARAYHGREYMYLPRLGELAEARRSLHQWHAENGSSAPNAEKEFDEHLMARLVEAADRNAISNDRRSAFAFVARIWLFVLLAMTAVTAVAYTAASATIIERNTVQIETLPPIKIEGTQNLVEALKMAKTPPTQQPQVPDPKPQFPSNRLVKEGALPKKK